MFWHIVFGIGSGVEIQGTFLADSSLRPLSQNEVFFFSKGRFILCISRKTSCCLSTNRTFVIYFLVEIQPQIIILLFNAYKKYQRFSCPQSPEQTPTNIKISNIQCLYLVSSGGAVVVDVPHGWSFDLYVRFAFEFLSIESWCHTILMPSLSSKHNAALNLN